jgi:hypothetical protein
MQNLGCCLDANVPCWHLAGRSRAADQCSPLREERTLIIHLFGGQLLTRTGHRPAFHVAVAKPVSALSMFSFEPTMPSPEP